MESQEEKWRGEAYRKELYRLERRKRVIARDVEGNPTLVSPKSDEEYGSEAHEVIRALQRELSSQREFIGVALNGSRVRGYALPTSDIDLTVLFDSSRDAKVDSRIKRIGRDTLSSLQKGGVLKNSFQGNTYDLEEGKIQRFLDIASHRISSPDEIKVGEAALTRLAIANLCGLAVGPRIEEYRDKLGQMIRALPHDNAREVMDTIATTAVELESNREDKRHERIPNLKSSIQPETLRARRNLWAKHILKVLKLEGTFRVL